MDQPDVNLSESTAEDDAAKPFIDLRRQQKLGIFQRCWQYLNLLGILVYKTNKTLLRRWIYVLGLYVGILTMFLVGAVILRYMYPYTKTESNTSNVELEVNKNWVRSGKTAHGVVLIGYAPRFPLIEALMEEAERILVRNGLPNGVKEFQTVAFDSEYSMEAFLRRQQGVIQYAFAFSIPGTSYPTLSTTLELVSYVHDIGCHDEALPPCPGDVYIAKVIMEAFINAHTGRENNVSVSYREVRENVRRHDPIFTPDAKQDVRDLYSVGLGIGAWAITYLMASEREAGTQKTLSRMGLYEILNFTANITILQLHALVVLMVMGLILGLPLLGSVPIITSSNFYVRFVFMVCYASSLVSYCALGSVIFTKASHWMMPTFLFAVFVYLDSYWDPPHMLRQTLLVLAAVATQNGIHSLLFMEQTAKGWQWNNTNLVYKMVPEGNSLNTETGFLLLSVPLQLLMATLVVYLRAPSSPLCLQGIKWPWSRQKPLPEFRQDMNNYEEQSESDRPCVVMKHVYTEEAYGKVAVVDINWTINEGEVSVAMGNENSGRLAILSVLYGDIRPVSGTATVFGLDCVQHSVQIRRNCGMCLKNNDAMFRNLTVRDNLWIFSRLRYHCQQRENDNISALVKDAKLEPVLDTEVWELKDEDRVILNVAIAFTGDSKLVILEDPTKDMHINTKMRVWNLIKRQCRGRSVLLSTMSMTEAQTIGDRITIFKDGHIHCSGSVPFLREFFGTGYYLDIEKRRSVSGQTLRAMLAHFCPDSVLLQDSSKRLVFLLPSSSTSSDLVGLLESLEQHQHELGIFNYDVQGSTLENAFINLTGGRVFTVMGQSPTAVNDGSASKVVIAQSRNTLILKSRFGIESYPTSQADTDLDDSINRTSPPSQTSSSEVTKGRQTSGQTRSGNESNDSSEFFPTSGQHDSAGEDEESRIVRREGLSLYLKRLQVLVISRFLVCCRSMEVEFIQAAMIVLLVLYYIRKPHDGGLYGEQVVDHRHVPEDFCPSFVAVTVRGGTEAIEHSADKRRLWHTLLDVLHVDAIHECSKVLQHLSEKMDFKDFIQSNMVTSGIPSYAIHLVPRSHDPMRALIYVSRASPGKSLIPALSAAMETFLRFATNDKDRTFEIRYRSVYEPPRFNRPVIATKLGAVATIVFICIAYLNINKRMNGTTMLDRLSGASPLSHWLSSFITDMVNYVFLAIVYFLTTQYTTPVFPKDGQTDWMIVIVLLYGAVMLTHIYCLQKLFRSAMIGTTAIMVLTFVSTETALKKYASIDYHGDHGTKLLVLPGFLLPAYLFYFGHNHHVDHYCPKANRPPCRESNYVDQCCSSNMQLKEGEPIFFVYVGLAHLIFWTSMLFIDDYGVHRALYRRLKATIARAPSAAIASKPVDPTEDDVSKADLAFAFTNIVSSANVASEISPSSQPSFESRKALGVSNGTKDMGNPVQSSSAVFSGSPVAATKSNTMPVSSSCVDFWPSPQSRRPGSQDCRTPNVEPDRGKEKIEPKEIRESLPRMLLKEINEKIGKKENCLVIDKLCKRPTLKDISAKVNMGDVFCFVNSDTAVTSDLLHCISGWSGYESGSVLMDGRPFGWQHPLSPVTIGYSPREERCSHVLSPRESLSIYCTLRGVIHVRREVKAILKVFKLTNCADEDPRNMSPGTHARFQVAKAMVGEPDLILLDQPLAELDSVGKITVWNAIRRAKRRGKTVIMTSNSIDACAGLATRVAIIVRGRVVVVSSPKGIREKFSNSYSLTARLDSCSKHVVDILILSLTQRFPNSEIFVDSLNYLYILLPFRTDSLADIFRLMESVKKQFKVSDFVLRHATLDNVIDALEEKESAIPEEILQDSQ